jgi:predicted RND superfamily exporter protein
MDNILTRFLSKRPLSLIAIVLILTGIFSYVSSEDNTVDEVSFDTGGKVFDLSEKVNRNFQSPVHFTSVIVESKNNDLLVPDTFKEILENQENLIKSDNSGQLAFKGGLDQKRLLFKYFDLSSGEEILGLSSVVDLTDNFLKQQMQIPEGVRSADFNQLKFAISQLIEYSDSNSILEVLPRDTKYTSFKEVENEYGKYKQWSSNALLLTVLLDNEELGGGDVDYGLGGDSVTIDKERVGREIVKILAGDENNYNLWPIAVDVNLYSEEQGAASGTYLVLTVIAAILVAGFSLRSYFTVAIIGFGISALILWLKGMSTILGLKGGLIADFIVPISMVSLGVDFAIHAIRRYQETKEEFDGNVQKALSVGLAAVSGALILAVLSDSLAFLSNSVTGIEALMHFGFAAAIATVSSFLLLGVMAPIAYMKVDQLLIKFNQNNSDINLYIRILFGAFAASVAGSSVILTVALDPGYGGLALLGYLLLFLVLPLVILKIFGKIRILPSKSMKSTQNKNNIFSNIDIVAFLSNVTNFKYSIVLSTILITVFAGYYALKLEPTFDVKDFFDPNSEFVIGLDKLDEYFTESAGEPAEIYFEGNLDSQKFVNKLNEFTSKLDQNEYVGKRTDGSIQFYDLTIFDVMKSVLTNDFALNAYSSHELGTKEKITDLDNDFIFDNSKQLESFFRLAPIIGVPKNEKEFLLSPTSIHTFLRFDDQNNVYFMRQQVGIPGTGNFETIVAAYEQLNEDIDIFRNIENDILFDYGITGSPFIRESQTSAATDSLRKSIPVAAIGALILLLIVTRSIFYSLVTVFPLLLIVVWLYAIMYAFGFGLNFVTATIGAVSIGVGLDFSIHMTERFKQELKLQKNEKDAIKVSMRGTGLALLGAGASSISGFSILSFAPMPLFATYGILSAFMITFAMLASVLIVPSLLLIVRKFEKGKL